MPGRLAVPPPSRRRTYGVAAAGIVALACAVAGQAVAVSDDLTPPPAAFEMPGATMTIVPSQITVNTRDEITFRVKLTRKLGNSALLLTLPTGWRQRRADGTRVVNAPNTGRGSGTRVRVRRTDRVVRFSFTDGRRRDAGSYTVTDRALDPGTYRLRFQLRVDGDLVADGTASVVLLALPAVTHSP